MSNHVTPPEVRFWSRVNKNGPLIEKMESCCWEYIPPRKLNKRRTINFFWGVNKYSKYKFMDIGRSAWILSFGVDVPKGMSVIRRCSNYSCVRPEHLYTGSHTRMLGTEVIDTFGVKWKKCTRCNELFIFNYENFGYGGWNGNIKPYCRKCAVKLAKKSATDHWERIAFYRAQDSSKEKHLEFDLTREFILNLFDKQKGLCYWLGIPMQPSIIHRYPFHPSLDRIDRNKGYTKNNVILCCQFMNVGRNSCSYDDFTEALKLHLDIFGKGLWNNVK